MATTAAVFFRFII